jgi:hypothetical protein
MYVFYVVNASKGLTGLPQKFQDLEEERIDFMKNSLWAFANIASTVCVSDDAVSHMSLFISTFLLTQLHRLVKR